ncbi:MAG: hslO [Rickettsiaceae bacterium]|jgi:molecular chaperone Hsp33|nr:hslO [Rickettsiaceae bacterium]
MKYTIMEFQQPANSNDLLKNTSLPFMLEASGVRGRCVRVNEELDNILNSNTYPSIVSHLLGELTVLVVMLGSLLKLKGMVTIQAQGEGAIGFISSDYTDEGHLRAYAHLRDEKFLTKTKATNISKLFGKGFLVITIQNQTDSPYQAVVPLEGESLTECISAYFRQSDQLDAEVEVAVGKVGNNWHAGGILLQHISQEGGKKTASKKADECNNASVLLKTVTKKELLDSKLPLNDLLYRLFHEEGVRVFDAQKLKAQCRCSRERMSGALKTISPAEIEEMKVDGVITMTCKFCNRKEVFRDGEF